MDAPARALLRLKLGLIVVGVTVVAIGLFGLLTASQMAKHEYAAATHRLREQSELVRRILTVNHDLMTLAAERVFDAFEARFDAPIQVDPVATRRRHGHDLALVTAGGKEIDEGYRPLQGFARDNPEHAVTIFVRHGPDFIRLATTLRDETGAPAVGTFLGVDHPAYNTLVGGHPYVGFARLFGRPYMTKYRPILDHAGRVVGALFVGLELSTTFAKIAEQIRSVGVADGGYVFVVDKTPGESFGSLLLHPSLQGRKLLEVTEPEEREFFRQALADGEGLAGRYALRDPAAGGELRHKIVAFTEFPQWHWLIGAAANYDEFTAERRALQRTVLIAALVAALAIIFALAISIRRLVLAPLLKMHAHLAASEERFRTLVASSDDIIHTTDAAGACNGIHGKGLEALLLPPGQMLGRRMGEVFRGESARHEDACRRALAGEHVVYEWRFTGAEGVVAFQTSLSPMRDAQGGLLGLVGISRDITERKRAEEWAQHMAQHDALTGLPNRVLMADRLEQALRQAERKGVRAGVMFLDLDRFKAINDSLGHEAGDQLLKVVAQRLSACVRRVDTVARLGGDEFVVVVNEAEDMAAIVRVAEKILAAFDGPVSLAAGLVDVSVSIGIGCYPDDADSAEGLLKLADAAMYRAKHAGRSTYRTGAGPGPGEAPHPLDQEERGQA